MKILDSFYSKILSTNYNPAFWKSTKKNLEKNDLKSGSVFLDLESILDFSIKNRVLDPILNSFSSVTHRHLSKRVQLPYWEKTGKIEASISKIELSEDVFLC